MARLPQTTALWFVLLMTACSTAPSKQPLALAPSTEAQQHRVAPIPPTTPTPAPRQAFRAPEIQRLPGLEGVIEKNASALMQVFGTPKLDVHEGDMRKLQFAGGPCVLDIYLYPLKPGTEPVATFVDARRASDGLDVDRASCVAALRRR